MKVIQLPDVLHEYLVHVIEKHAGTGIHPEEGMAVAKLWDAVTKNVTHLDDQQVRAMAAAGTYPAGTPGGPSLTPHIHLSTDPHVPGQPCACDPQPAEQES